MGRPTKLTPQTTERIVQAIKAGNYAEPACRSAGISPSSYYRWLERGEHEPDGIYHDFAAAIRQAEADAEVHAVALLRRAMPNDWRAALAYLERRYPNRWRRHTTTELSGPGGGPIQTETVDLSRLSTDELEQLHALYARASTDNQPVAESSEAEQ